MCRGGYLLEGSCGRGDAKSMGKYMGADATTRAFPLSRSMPRGSCACLAQRIALYKVAVVGHGLTVGGAASLWISPPKGRRGLGAAERVDSFVPCLPLLLQNVTLVQFGSMYAPAVCTSLACWQCHPTRLLLKKTRLLIHLPLYPIIGVSVQFLGKNCCVTS